MNTPDDGGPAFPRPLSGNTSEGVAHDQEGMRLRDYFAAKAMDASATAVTETVTDTTASGKKTTRTMNVHKAAAAAYAYADAMLAARKGGEK